MSGIGAHRELSFLLSADVVTIGSAETSDLVIPVLGVSRTHARLRVLDERLEVEDLGSRNGTFLGAHQIARGTVEEGAVLRLGPVELRLERVDAGDAELAMVLSPALPRDPSPFPADESTAGFTGWVAPAQDAAELAFPEGYVPGQSDAMVELYRLLAALRSADLPVLIEGETGVGKELVAQTLHRSSVRRDGPFVAVNCAAIPADLLEAEMFGIGEGVATGVRKRTGRFVAAQGGALFLDELGEMPLELQAKLLRALQEKEIQPVGSPPVPVDVWVISATNTDLRGRAERQRFRQDLYYRVAGSVLRVPALRERAGDIPLLLEHFLRRSAAQSGKLIRGMTVKALAALEAYPWPGNVRELEHLAKRLAHACADGQAIDSKLLPELYDPPPPLSSEAEVEGEAGSLRLEDHVQAAERRAIIQALAQSEGSQRQAARLLGISRNTLARKIRQLEIRL
ncbi:MAG: sigma 54-interacting transcriptional regulator [Acidobacteriota bacterium]